MKELWLFFTQQYLQRMQANLNLVMNLSKVEGFLFGYGNFKTVTGRSHWGGSNLEWDCWNPDCTKAKNQPWLLQALYSKPYALRLLPLLLHWNCCCQSSKSSLQIQWSIFTSTFTQHGWWLSSETLPSFCLQVIFICMSIPQFSGYSVIYSSLPDFWTMAYPELSPQTFCLFYLHEFFKACHLASFL